MKIDYKFWKDKKIFLFGCTSKESTILAITLSHLGARVCGYGNEADRTYPPFIKGKLKYLFDKDFSLRKLDDCKERQEGMMDEVYDAILSFNPDIVLNMSGNGYLDHIIYTAYDKFRGNGGRAIATCGNYTSSRLFASMFSMLRYIEIKYNIEYGISFQDEVQMKANIELKLFEEADSSSNFLSLCQKAIKDYLDESI